MHSSRDASLLAEHQHAAVDRLLPLLARYGGAVLADEPGLGKSFIAAEVGRRSQAAGVAIEAVVPASLVPQWRETFRRFCVSASVVTHTSLVRSHLPQPRGRRLLIVDEAHAFRNPETQRYDALARRSVGAMILLVTATPVCNSPRDLESLLRLAVADDALAAIGVPSIDLAFLRRDRESLDAVVAELVIRRDRDAVPAALRFGDLDRRVIRMAAMPDSVRHAIATLPLPLVESQPLVRDFLIRRLESSEAALHESLRRQRRFYERALECVAAGRALRKREYRRVFGREEDAAGFQRVLFWELFVPSSAQIEAAAVEEAIVRIDALRTQLEQLPRAKEQRLVELCRATAEPMLVFTCWSATARSLFSAVREVRRAALMTGRERSSAAVIEAFRRGAVDVLVSTDVGAEGLNLQRAGVVVHYDLPWNPMRIDQRNGRAHRIGQTRETVRAVYFLPHRSSDSVLQTVVAKKRTGRRVLAATDAAPAARAATATLRPRVSRDAAVVAFAAAAERAGWRVPLQLDRRHRAGIERLLTDLAAEPIDAVRLCRLEEALSEEPPTSGHPCRFTHL